MLFYAHEATMSTSMSRQLFSCLLLLASFAPSARAFDPSDYRQNTYGPPTHYCDPARALTSTGAGTLSDPWNLNQAMTLAAAGNVVGFLPGIGARLHSTDDDNTPTFNPANSGTANSRIVFVTKYAAVALPNVAANPNRTELRHDGTAPQAAGQFENGTGSPMYGAYFRSYITYDGFFVDMAQAYPMGDSGVIRVDNAVGVHFRNFEIKGTRTNMQSNAVIYRPQDALDTVLSNFRAYDFSNDTTGSDVPQRALFSDQYGDQNFLIEHFEIRNTERGIFLKGSGSVPASNLNYGRIRYGIVSGVSSCYQFNAMHASSLTTLEYNICHDVTAGAGIVLSAETAAVRNLLAHHNTVARVNGTDINTNGGFYSRANGIGVNVAIRDNLIDIDNGPFGHGADFAEIATLPAVFDYNGYYKNGANLTWAYNGAQSNGIAAWRAATNRDANSFVPAFAPFVNRAAADFHIVGGHAAKTASSTGGEIGAYAGSEPVGVDVVGGTVPPADVRPPAKPENLREL